jgi:hypothetical protein
MNSPVEEKRRFDTRALAQIALAGVAAAVIGQAVGKTCRLCTGLPVLGGLAAGLPRAALILLVAGRVGRFGTMGFIGLVEGIVSTMVGGLMPLALVMAAGSGLAGDCVMHMVPNRALKPYLAGAALVTARTAGAVGFLYLVRVPGAGNLLSRYWLLPAVGILSCLAGLAAGALSRALAAELKEVGIAA